MDSEGEARSVDLVTPIGLLLAGLLSTVAVLAPLGLGGRLGVLAMSLLAGAIGGMSASRAAAGRRLMAAAIAEQAEEQRAELERLLSAALTSQLRGAGRGDLGKMLSELAATMGAEVAVCYLLDRQTAVLVPAGDAVGLGPAQLTEYRMGTKGGDEALNQVLVGNAPFVRHTREATGFRLLPRSLEVRSLLVAPMLVDESAIGLVALASSSPDRFGDKDGVLATATASAAGAALMNERLLSTNRQQLRHSSVVKEVALAVNSTLELNHVLHLFLGKARGIVNFDRAAVVLFDHGSYRIQALVDAEGSWRQRSPQDMAGSLAGSPYEAVGGGNIVSRTAMGSAEAYATEAPAEVRLGMAFSEVLVPLRSKGAVVGCVAFRAPAPDGFPSSIYPELFELANLAGMAITNSIVHADTAGQARHLDLLLGSLSEVSRMLTATTEGPGALERRITAILARLFDSPVAVLTRVIDGDHRVAAAHGTAAFHGAVPDVARVVTGAGLIGSVALEQRTLTREATSRDDLLPGAHDVHLTSGLAAPMVLDGHFQGSLAVFSNRVYDQESEVTVLTTIANQVAVALRNAELFQRNQRSLWELSNLHEGLKAIASSLDMEQVLSTILQKAAAVSDAQIGSIMLVENGKLVVRASHGTDGATAQALVMGVGEGIAGQVVASGQPILANDAASHPDYVPGPPGAPVPKALLCVPMHLGETVIGVINLANYARADVFESESVRVVSSLANQTSIAVENARLYQHLRAERDRLVSLEEVLRQDLARDLHDGPVQRLAGMAMNIEVVRRLLVNDPARAGVELDELEELVRITMREARTMLFELRPLVLETQGVLAALSSYAEQFEANTGLEVDLEMDDGYERYPAAVEQTIFSVVQEALGNVRKHARATHVSVALHRDRESVVARVTDDGRGFDVKATEEGYADRPSQSLGMVNMVERAERIGGALKIDSRPGEGTSVTLTVPARYLLVEPAAS